MKLIETETVDEFIYLVSKTYYGGKYNKNETLTIEKLYANCLSHLYLIDRRNDPYSIASINTYLFLKEEEMQKLTTLLECIRYGLTAHETLQYIGGMKPQ